MRPSFEQKENREDFFAVRDFVNKFWCMRISRQVSRCYFKLQPKKKSLPGNSTLASSRSPPPTRTNPNAWTVTGIWSDRPVRSSRRRTVRALLCSSAFSPYHVGPSFSYIFLSRALITAKAPTATTRASSATASTPGSSVFNNNISTTAQGHPPRARGLWRYQQSQQYISALSQNIKEIHNNHFMLIQRSAQSGGFTR